MRRLSPLLFSACLFFFLVSECLSEMPSSSSTSPGTAKAERVLGVEELMKDVDEFRGTVNIEGVVSQASDDDDTISLIDLRELAQCGVTTCAEYTLPVKWNGRMPAIKDVVKMKGEIKEKDGKLLFFATSISPAENSEGRE
jgi:hypothetical protein